MVAPMFITCRVSRQEADTTAGEADMFCIDCGKPNQEGARFCLACGNNIGAVSGPGGKSAAAAHEQPKRGVLQSLGNRISSLASTNKLDGFSLSEFFSEVFKKRSKDQIDDYFVVGTARTTPPIEEVATNWPKPWFFFRVLIFLVLVYLGFYAAFEQFGNIKLIPGLIMMGSLAVPLAVVYCESIGQVSNWVISEGVTSVGLSYPRGVLRCHRSSPRVLTNACCVRVCWEST